MLAHKGLEAESVLIEYSDRSLVEQVSGQGLVPVIDDDGEVVSDSIRIFEYLERRYPEPPIYPSEPARRAEVEVFIDWFTEVWKLSPNTIENELEGSPDPQVIERESALMAQRLEIFERMLDGRDHLMGPEVSAADFAAFPFLKYALLPVAPGDEEVFHEILFEHQPIGEDHPRLAAWIERVDERPRV